VAGERGKRKKRRPQSGGAARDNPAQSARFIDAAKALGVNESEEAFDKALRALLKLKPKGKRGSN
jgi:hypothetical protein